MKNKPTKDHIIIDCQLLQGSARYRGMGLFLVSLLKALAAKKDDGIVWSFLINDNLPPLSQDDTNLLNDLQGDIISAKLLTIKDRALYNEASETNRKTLDQLLKLKKNKENYTKTVFFIPALYNSDIYPVFPSEGTANILLFHDIIPFLYYKDYFANPDGPERIDYAQRWREAYRADLFVTNSQTTADDLNIYFGVDPSRIKAIYGAGANREGLKPHKPTFADKLSDNFILMPSGDDYRKNNPMGVEAVASLGTDIQLVITSAFSPPTIADLKKRYKKIIFSGSVSDEEMVWLTDNASVVFFPTLYEGLGMPVFEAVSRGAIVACSRIPIFTEVSEDAFFFFDPKSSTSMRTALLNALEEKSTKKPGSLNELYQKINLKFTWTNSAERFLEAAQEVKAAGVRKKLAVFSPSPLSYSAIGKYVFLAHAELSRYYDIDYYVENGQTEYRPSRPNILDYAAGYLKPASFNYERNPYDAVLFNIGNSEFHVETILTALRYPANAIFHDTYLNGVFDYMETGNYLTSERRSLETKIDAKLGINKSSCISSLVSNQKRVFGHSLYAEQAIEAASPNKKVKVTQLNLSVGVPEHMFESEGVTVSFAGIMSENKGLKLVNEISQIDNLKIKVFGFGVLEQSTMFSNPPDNLEVIRDLTDKEFQDALRTTDILINYRDNYHGETSLSTLEAMRYGSVVIVRDVGWFSELPSNCVVKAISEDEVREAVMELAVNATKRKSIGLNARKYLAKEYSFSKYANLLVSNLEENR